MTHPEDTHDLFDDRDARSGAANDATPVVAASDAGGPGAETGSGGQPVGARLRAAREAKGLTIPECGARLHLPVKVLERLERDDFGSPEHFVFLRGALKGYASLLGLPSDCCDDALRSIAPPEQPPLVAVARTSHTRWLLQRYGTAATYIVLTATIAVPLVLLGLRGGLERPAARIVSLDQAAVATPSESRQAVDMPRVKVDTPEPQDLTPFRASMTPFSAMALSDFNHATPPAATREAPAQAGVHTLTVAASADCWVEVTDAEGNKLASELLHAGDTRNWQSSGPLHVTVGNVDGVTVTRDGQPMSLDSYRRANVARFEVFGPAAGGGGENH